MTTHTVIGCVEPEIDADLDAAFDNLRTRYWRGIADQLDRATPGDPDLALLAAITERPRDCWHTDTIAHLAAAADAFNAARADAAPMVSVETRWGDHIWLWVPRVVATGRGPAEGSPRLTGTHISVYLTLLARADNATRRYRLTHPNEVAQRCGITTTSLQSTVRRLAAAGLLSIEQQGRGQATVVRVVPGSSQDHFAVPEAAVWPDPWPAPPRWNHTDLGPAIRALLAILRVLRHPDAKRPTVTTHLPAAIIAKGAQLALSDYRHALPTLLGAATTGWLTSDTRYRPDPAQGVLQDTSILTLDWTRLPASGSVKTTSSGCAKTASSALTHTEDGKKAQPEDGKKAQPEDGKKAQPEDGKKAQPEDGKKAQGNTSGAFTTDPLTSDPTTTSAVTPVTAATAPPVQRAVEEEVDDDDDRLDRAIEYVLYDAATNRRHIEDAYAKHTTDRRWNPTTYSGIVLANLVLARDTHRIAPTITEARSLHTEIVRCQAAGWHPVALAAEILTQPTTGLRNPIGAVVARIRKAAAAPPVTRAPSDADGPWAAASTAPRKLTLVEQAALKNPVWGDSRAKTYTSEM